MRRVLILAFGLLALSVAGMSQQQRQVLFVGNSYVYVNDLPQMLANVAESMGDEAVCESNTPGGCTFSQHCQNHSMDLIRQGGWDVVVLQEQSQYPSFPQWQVEQQVFPYAARLVDSAYTANPCVEPMFFMTWGRKNGDHDNASIFPPLGTYEGMDSLLAARYMQMGADNDASVCPVGRVWHRLRHTYPAIELYQSDESHPSQAGTYAAACSFYVMIFGRDPDSIAYDAGLPASVAASIREAVRAVVFDSLARWQRPQPEAMLTVSDTIRYMTESFDIDASNADSLRIEWGDGADTVIIPSGHQSVSYTYATPGDYHVGIVAMRHCMKQEYGWTFTAVTGTSVDMAEEVRTKVFPNPAIECVYVSREAAMELYSLDGRLLRHRWGNAMPLDGLPAGAYLLSVDGNRRLIIKK